MITYTCIEQRSDESGRVRGFVLKSPKGEIKYFGKTILTEMIIFKEICVDNLKYGPNGLCFVDDSHKADSVQRLPDGVVSNGFSECEFRIPSNIEIKGSSFASRAGSKLAYTIVLNHKNEIVYINGSYSVGLQFCQDITINNLIHGAFSNIAVEDNKIRTTDPYFKDFIYKLPIMTDGVFVGDLDSMELCTIPYTQHNIEKLDYFTDRDKYPFYTEGNANIVKAVTKTSSRLSESKNRLIICTNAKYVYFINQGRLIRKAVNSIGRVEIDYYIGSEISRHDTGFGYHRVDENKLRQLYNEFSKLQSKANMTRTAITCEHLMKLIDYRQRANIIYFRIYDDLYMKLEYTDGGYAKTRINCSIGRNGIFGSPRTVTLDGSFKKLKLQEISIKSVDNADIYLTLEFEVRSAVEPKKHSTRVFVYLYAARNLRIVI